MVMRRDLVLGAGAAAVAAGSAAWANKNGMGSMADHKAAVAEPRRSPSTAPETRDLIRYATLGPERAQHPALAVSPDRKRCRDPS